MEIKKLDESNLKEIYELEQLAMTTDTTFPLTMDELEETWASGYEAYGVYDKDVLIGKVAFTKMPEEYELDICVHPEYQGKGVGTFLMNEGPKMLRKKYPNAKIFLRVHPQNPSLHLYERTGFVGEKDEQGEYMTSETNHGPRIRMEFSG